MVRAKDRPILFEVVRRKKPLRGAGPSRAPVVAETVPDIAPSLRLKPSGLAEPEAVRTVSADASVPAFRFSEGRLHVSLGWVGLTGWGIGLLVLVLVVFQGGLRYAGKPSNQLTSDDPALSAALRGPADPSVLDLPESERRTGSGRIATPPPSDAGRTTANNAENRSRAATPTRKPPAAPKVVRKKGYHYLIIQHFPQSKLSAAKAARDYLVENGVPCAVLRTRDDHVLIARQGFLIEQADVAAGRADRKRRDALKRRIIELGKAYNRIGGYRFAECYSKKY